MAKTARTLPTPFAGFDLNDARRVVTVAISNLRQRLNVIGVDVASGGGQMGVIDTYAFDPIVVSRAFIQGDHWQGGLGWVGPRPQMTDPAYLETMTEIARAFVSKNIIAEITYRHVNGVVGIEPHWGLTSLAPVEEDEEVPAEIQTLIDEAEAKLTKWWDDRKMPSMLQQLVVTLLYAERSMARLYIPRGMLVDVPIDNPNGTPNGEGGTVKAIEAVDVDDALTQIYIDHPLPELSTVAQDPDTKQYLGVAMFRVGQGVEAMGSYQERAELCYLEGDRDAPLTVLKTVGTDGVREFKNDWGGMLPMHEMHRPLFITPQMWQQQRAANLAISMIPRGNVTAGFLERTIMNAQMPGTWQVDTTTGKRTAFIPSTYATGPGTTNFLQGLEVQDAVTGHTQLTTPSINYRDPVPTTPLIESARSHYSDMLEEGSQEHTLAYTNTRASGKTHEQARADFTTSLRRTQASVEPLGRWLIMTLLHMAEQMGGEEGKYTSKLRAYFNCRIDTGPITADERNANNASVAAGTLSVESAIVRNGETDPDAELQKLSKEPGHNLSIIARQAAVILALTQAGAALKGAAMAAGFEGDVLTELMAGYEAPVQPTIPPNPDGSVPPQ